MVEILDYVTKNVKTYVNEEKKTVTTVIEACIKMPETDTEFFKRFVGKAKCAPEDKFDVEIGKKISKNRAWIKYNDGCIKILDKEMDELMDFENVLDGKRFEYAEYNQTAIKELKKLTNKTEEEL